MGRSAGRAGRAVFVAMAMSILLAASPLLADSINYSPAAPNVEQSVSFQYVPTGGVKNSIRWEFGDGSVYLSMPGVLTASHAYTATSLYKVQAQIQLVGSVAPVIKTTVMVVERRFVAYVPLNPMPVQPVTFIANNFFSASLLWDFDDAPPFNGGARQVHAFREAGTHRVVVRDWDGKSVVPITVRVPVGGSPSIEYAPDEPRVNDPVEFRAVNFTSTSLVRWDFGDGAVENDTSPPLITHAYRNPGTYSVRAFDGGSGSPTAQISVKVLAERLITFSPADPRAGEEITFRAVNFTSTSLVRWDFGDGAVENDTSPPLITHAYRNPGTYSVRAFDGGSGSPTAQISVKVLAERLITFSPADPRAGEEITFRAVNFSSRTLRWDFGDGTVLSAGTQVTHAYVSPRTYSVRAFDGGSGSPSAQTAIRILPERLITFSPADPRAGEEITFKAINFSSPTLRWDFGDGTVLSAGAQVTHVFKTAGPWMVKAFDRSGSAEVVKNLSIMVFPNQGPRSKFAISFIQLRFEDGKSYKVVPREFGALTAFAEIKFEGTGVLQAQWLVDGMPFKTVFTNLSFAGSTIIDSGSVPGLPSLIPGLHEVTLRLMQPVAEFEVPVIRYFVTADAVPREAVDFLLDGAVTIDGTPLGGDDVTIEAPVGKHFLLKGWVRNESGTAVAFALLRVFLDDEIVDQKIVQDLKPGEERGFESSVFNPTAGRKRLVLALYNISRRPAAILYLREISVVPPK